MKGKMDMAWKKHAHMSPAMAELNISKGVVSKNKKVHHALGGGSSQLYSLGFSFPLDDNKRSNISLNKLSANTPAVSFNDPSVF
jgi:hypothetical protein